MKKEIKNVGDNIVQYTTEDSRFYKVQHEGKELILPSVTYILKSLPMNDQLLRWYCDLGYNEAKRYMEERADMGSAVHKACELLLTGKEVKHDFQYEGREISASEWKAILSFVQWYRDTTAKADDVKVIAVEKTYFDTKLKCAGSVDLVIMIDGVVHVIDFKTSSSIFLSHEVQVSIYGKMVAEALGMKPKEVKRGVLLLGYNKNKKGYFYKDVEDLLPLFKSARVVHEHLHGKETTKTIELPLSAKL